MKLHVTMISFKPACNIRLDNVYFLQSYDQENRHLPSL